MTTQLFAQLILVQVGPPRLAAQEAGHRALDALPQILVGGLRVHVGHALAPELIEGALRLDLAYDFVDQSIVAGHMLEVAHRMGPRVFTVINMELYMFVISYRECEN